MNSKWDDRFLRIASEVSTWSKDPGSKIGAVVVDDDHRILSVGYNGLPRGMVDDDRVLDRDFKLRHTVHAEVNAILNAAHSGVSLKGSTMYVHGLPPCRDCAKAIAQTGVKRVVFDCPVTKPEWEESFATTRSLFKEVGISCEEFGKEDESSNKTSLPVDDNSGFRIALLVDGVEEDGEGYRRASYPGMFFKPSPDWRVNGLWRTLSCDVFLDGVKISESPIPLKISRHYFPVALGDQINIDIKGPGLY